VGSIDRIALRVRDEIDDNARGGSGHILRATHRRAQRVARHEQHGANRS
jgi:hypothetical protein